MYPLNLVTSVPYLYLQPIPEKSELENYQWAIFYVYMLGYSIKIEDDYVDVHVPNLIRARFTIDL